jgi:hypothetical protein
MAIISMFFGIIVSMNYLDKGKHNLPHIYVKYQDEAGRYFNCRPSIRRKEH